MMCLANVLVSCSTINAHFKYNSIKADELRQLDADIVLKHNVINFNLLNVCKYGNGKKKIKSKCNKSTVVLFVYHWHFFHRSQ